MTARAPRALLLPLAMLAASFGQMALGALAPLFRADLGLSAQDVGLLGSLMFGAAAAWSPVAGYLADRFGGRSQLVAVYGTTSASLFVLSAAQSRSVAAVSMILGGAALASANPATNELISSHSPRNHQASMVAAKQTGAQAAGIVAGLLPVAAAFSGWRSPLVALGFASLLMAVIAGHRLPSGRNRDAAHTPRSPAETALGPEARRIWIYALTMGTAVGATVSYLPLYAVDRLGMSAALAGSLLVVLALFGVISLAPWVRLAASSQKPTAVLAIMAVIAGFALSAVGGSSIGPRWLLMLGLVALGATYTTWLAVAMFAIVRGGTGPRSGRVSAAVMLAFFLGMTIGPSLFGQVLGLLGYDYALAMVIALYMLGGVNNYVFAAKARRRRV